MISDFKAIQTLIEEIDTQLTTTIQLYLIGGAALLYQGLKPSTKDIDLIVKITQDQQALKKALTTLQFTGQAPTIDYQNLQLDSIMTRQDFRIDIFAKTVCKKFSLSKQMINRATQLQTTQHLTLNICSNEDIFLFKTMTTRPGDIEDCISLAKRGLNWQIIQDELTNQIKENGQDIWVTWIGERLDIMQEQGLNIPIMKHISQMRDNYFNNQIKKMKK